MKKCPFCGADIEDSARFCLYCMQSLTEKEQILLHQKKKPQWLLIIAAIAVSVAFSIILIIILSGKQEIPTNQILSEEQQNSTPATTQTEPSDPPPATEPIHIHNYSVENTVIEYQKKAATCTAPAIFYYSCACGEKGSETFPYGETANHTIVTESGYPATCTNAGLTNGTHCSVCGIVLSSQTTIPIVNHTYDNNQDESCNVCNYIRVLNCKHAKTVNLPGVSPTCTASGLTEGKTCALCEEILTVQSALAPLGHREVSDQAVSATCTTSGKTEGKHCATCNTVLSPQVTLPAKGHTVVIDQAIAPTCTTDGKTEGKHCAVCKTVIQTQTTVQPLGHTEIIYAKGSAPTCITSGKTDEIHCAVCKTVIQTQTTVQPLGHNIVVWTEGFPATCTTPGRTRGTRCSICHEDFESSYEIPATWHSFSVEDSPSACSACGASETLTIVAPQLPLVVNSFGYKKPFRIDRITYSLKPITDGTFNIAFTFYGTNISSEGAFFDISTSLHGPDNVALSSSLSKYLAPDQSDIYKSAAQISDSNGTYTLVFN